MEPDFFLVIGFCLDVESASLDTLHDMEEVVVNISGGAKRNELPLRVLLALLALLLRLCLPTRKGEVRGLLKLPVLSSRLWLLGLGLGLWLWLCLSKLVASVASVAFVAFAASVAFVARTPSTAASIPLAVHRSTLRSTSFRG
jgi:hypothetical protein